MRAAAISEPSVSAPRVAMQGLSPPIDLVHLARATDGDESLEAELLAMFARQAEKLSPRLRLDELPRRARADIAHRLRGSALAIGAFAVAEAGDKLEAALEAEGAEPWAEIAAFEAAIGQACEAIAKLAG